MNFRAVWPIVDDTVPWSDLLLQAQGDIPALARQAHARITGPGHFRRAPSAQVPGSGGISKHCLVFEAPATPAQPRAYHRRSAA